MSQKPVAVPHFPVSFYEHMGYTRVAINKLVVLVWKLFSKDAIPPALLHRKRAPAKGTTRINVSVFVNGWCGVGCDWCIKARQAVSGLERLVTYKEIDTSDRTTMLAWGIEDGVFLDDSPFEAPPLWRSEDLRNELLRLSNHKACGYNGT